MSSVKGITGEYETPTRDRERERDGGERKRDKLLIVIYNYVVT